MGRTHRRGRRGTTRGPEDKVLVDGSVTIHWGGRKLRLKHIDFGDAVSPTNATSSEKILRTHTFGRYKIPFYRPESMLEPIESIITLFN